MTIKHPGLRKAARQLGISHSYLARKAKAKEVPRNADGTFDVEAVARVLKATTDPALVRRNGQRTQK